MLRMSPKTPQYGARLRLSPKTSAIAPRGFARCKTTALTVRTASFRSLRRLRSRIWPISLSKPSWSEPSPLHFDPAHARPLSPWLSCARIYVAPSKTQMRWLALSRLRPMGGDAVTQQTRPKASARGWLSRPTGEAYGARSCAPVASPCSPVLHTTHIVRSFRSSLASHLYS
jgi:hypothetical protein